MFILSPPLSGYPHSRVHLGRKLFNLYTVTVDKILRGRPAVVLLYDVVFCLIYCSHIYLLNAAGVSGKNYPAIRVLFFQNAFYVSFTLFKFFFNQFGVALLDNTAFIKNTVPSLFSYDHVLSSPFRCDFCSCFFVHKV